MVLCVCGLRGDRSVCWMASCLMHLRPAHQKHHMYPETSNSKMPSSSRTTHCHGGAHSKCSQTSRETYAAIIRSHVVPTTMPLDGTSATLSIDHQYWSRHFADRPNRNRSPNPTRFGASEAVIEERMSHRSLFGGRSEVRAWAQMIRRMPVNKSLST